MKRGFEKFRDRKAKRIFKSLNLTKPVTRSHLLQLVQRKEGIVDPQIFEKVFTMASKRGLISSRK